MVSVEKARSAAFTESEYINPNAITESHIYSVEHRYLIPIMGEELCEKIRKGGYTTLLSDYVVPIVGELIRIEIDHEAYPARSSNRKRCRTLLAALSEHLNDNGDSYTEYCRSENVMNRCRIIGSIVI